MRQFVVHAQDQRRAPELTGPHAGLDETPLTAFEDAVEDFRPDHILVALRGPEHAHWQEKGLIDRLESRFNLPGWYGLGSNWEPEQFFHLYVWLPLAIFGIENDGVNLAINLLILFLVVVYLALIAYTYLDAKRRLEDPVLVGCATVA